MPAEPLPLTDEDLSAIIDGEADDATLERFRADEAAGQRIRELQRASDLLHRATVTPLPAATVDRLVAVALAELDGTDAAPAGTDDDGPADRGRPAEGANVVPLAPPARSGRGRGAPPALLVAAVVVLFAAVGLGLVWSGTRQGGSDTAAPRTTEANERVGEVGDAAPSHEAPMHAPNAVLTTTPIIDLGTFDDLVDIRSALAGEFPVADAADAPNEKPTRKAVNRCAGQVLGAMKGENLVSPPTHVGIAEVDGEARMVFEFTKVDDDYDALVSIVAPADCDVESTFVK